MAEMKPITIVGGGLAGLTLGVGLRQRGVPVAIHEAGHYPRHRVCGEFISGRGQATLARLGLRELFDQAGAVSARTTAFFFDHPINRAAPAAFSGHLPFAFHAGRRAGEKVLRTWW